MQRINRIAAMTTMLLIFSFASHRALAATAGITTAGTTTHPMLSPVRLTLTDVSGPSELGCTVIDAAGTFAYVGTNTSPGKVIKIRLSDMTKIDTLTLSAGENNLRCATIDPNGSFAYFGTFTSPGIVVKVRLSDFTRFDALTFPAGRNGLACAMQDIEHGSLYFGTGAGGEEGWVVRVRNDFFDVFGEAKISDSPLTVCHEHLNGGYGFFTDGTNISSLALQAMSVFSVATLTPEEGKAISMALDHDLGMLFVGTDAAPGKVLRINADTYVRAGSETLNADEGAVRSLAIDEKGFVLYAGLGTNRIVKLVIQNRGLNADYKRVGALTMDAGENAVQSVLKFKDDKAIFFGGQTAVEAVKVPLANYKGLVLGTRITLPVAGTPNDFRYYTHFAVGISRMALYDDANPRNLIWQSNLKSNTGNGDFVKILVNNGSPGALPELPVGNYWLALQIDVADEVPSYAPAASGLGFVMPQAFGPYPATISPAATIDLGSVWSMSMTYSPPNAAPTNITLGGPGAANENSATGTLIGNLNTVDPNAGDAFTYTFVAPEANAGGRYAVEGTQLRVNNGALLNYEAKTSWDVRIKSTDQGGLNFTKLFTIPVGNVNEAPTNVTLDGTRSVIENSANGTAIGNLGAVDQDQEESQVYSFLGPESSAGGRFQIAGAQLQVGNAALINYENNRSHQVRIRATDHGGLTTDKVFTISVTDVNEAPTNITLSGDRTVNEHAPNNTVVGTLATVDQDGGVFAYSFIAPESNAGGRFKAEASQLKVLDGTLLDYNTRHSHAIRLRSTDNGGLTTDKAFTITLLQITNLAPTNIGLSGPRTVDEGAATETMIGTLSTVDPNPSQTFTYSFAAPESNAGGRFQITGSQLQVGNGALIDYETKSSHQVRVRSTDQGGLFVDKLFTIAVNNLPE